MKKIGFIGVGIMGKSMVRNLRKAGYEVAIYTRTKAKAEDVIAEGAVWCEAIVGAVCDFGGTLDEDVLLKWPNDIFAGGKKLGGVLAEMVPIPDCGDRVAIVIGVGLNLAVAQERLPIDKSTSLQLVARNLPDAMVLRDAIAVRWVQGLRSRLADFEEDPHREAVRAREAMTPICWTLGKQCEAHFVDGTTLQGRAVALNDDASLTIEDQEGVLHRVSTADVGVLSK